MYRTVLLVCLFLGLAHGMGPRMLFNKCHRHISSMGTAVDNGKHNITLSSDCTKGVLWWHYPRGTVQVNVPEKPDRPFTMCVGYVMYRDTRVRRVRYTTARETKIISLPAKKDETVCFESNGGMSLEFIRPIGMNVYLACIPYTIKHKTNNRELKMNNSRS